MPPTYLISLVVAVVVAMAAGLLLTARLGTRSGRASRPAALAVLLGWSGLAFHCSAMFYRSSVESIPGTGPLVEAVNGMGTASVVAFAVPAALLLVGFRRALPWLLGVVAAALLVVGVTMYNGASLGAHLTAIFVAVVVTALTTAELLAAGRTAGPRYAR